MAVWLNTFTVDAHDPARLAEFWSKALDWLILTTGDEEAMIAPGTDPSALPGAVPLLFLRNPVAKSVKNRLHLDLVPDDQQAEVARLVRLGASEVDIGQHDVDWVVMADPEGNEFCVLRTYEG